MTLSFKDVGWPLYRLFAAIKENEDFLPFVLEMEIQTKGRVAGVRRSAYEGEIKRSNAYAETLINGYASYRAKDLEAWGLSLKDRKNKLLAELVEIEAGESKLKAKTGIMSPQECLTAVMAR